MMGRTSNLNILRLLLLLSLLFNLVMLGSAIISPPTEKMENFAQIFNDWRETRNQYVHEMKHPMGIPYFNCSRAVSFAPPSSVHQLHPSNIEIIAALGDSVTVAQAAGAITPKELLKQYPGVSFATGNSVGLNEQATLYNMFRKFSPRLRGGSHNQHDHFYDFNFAVPGAFSSELPEQTEMLAATLDMKLGEENQKTWKFLNIFIGHNDLCKICENQTLYGPEVFGESLRMALRTIRDRIPMVFVNVMPPINVQIHTEAHNVSKFCEVAHGATCPCIFKLDKLQYLRIKEQFDEQLSSVLSEFPSSDTFTVVIAPAMDLKAIPKLNEQANVGLLALDCFHLSPIAHDIAAKQVWKGLFEKVGEKSITSELSGGFDRFVCPPEDCPFLRTKENSESCGAVPKFKILQISNVQKLELVGGGETMGFGLSGPGFLMIAALFVFGTSLIALFVRSTTRRPSVSREFLDERIYLLPPKRADLNDYIF